MKSFFTRKALQEKIARLKETKRVPEWLVSTLEKVAAEGDKIKPAIDQQRFVDEHIYPH